MYNLFLETLEHLNLNVPRWFFWIVLVVVILIGMNFLLKKYVKPIVEYFEDLNERAVKIKEIDNEITILKENQLRNSEKYKAADEELQKEIKKVTEKINVIAQMIIDMQKRIDESNIAKLKDRIREIYAEHHRSQIITKMELETLEGLIDDYTAAGGNSFVHSTVTPELFNWQVVDDDYYIIREEKDKLNKSYTDKA